MRLRKQALVVLSLLIIASMVVVGCAAPAAAPPAAEQPAPAAEATEAPAEEAAVSERAKTLIMDIDGGRVADPELWNPLVPGNRKDHGYHQLILEPLFILNYQTGEFIPWLGVSFEPNADMNVWTLKLREGITWQDGEAFNADDVVFTGNMILGTPELPANATLVRWIESVNKIDDLTIEFVLKEPNPRFLLDFFAVRIWGDAFQTMPEHIWKDQDPLTFKYYDPAQGWPVGTGPYKLASVSPTEFTYVRDDNYWGAKTGFTNLPAPEKVVWMWAGPEETRAALMANKQLDSLMDITLGALQALQDQNPNVITWFDEPPYAWVPDPCSRTLEFNTTREPWNDPEMRWAINYAIDRDEIVAIAYEGTTLKSRHFFPAYPPLDAMVDKAIEAGTWNLDQLWTHDPDMAKQIIESKGYTLNSNGYYEKDGQELSLDITTHEAFIEKQRIAQVIVEQLQRIGINASTRNEAGSTWSENFWQGNFEAKMGWQTCGSVNEPWRSMDTFNVRWVKPVGERAADDQNSWRWTGANADAYSAVVDEIGVLPLGDPAVDGLFVDAMQYWFEDLPVIPITQAKKIIPFDTTYWTGWPTAADDYIHPPTWWQHTHVILHNLQPAGGQ
ncbi:MAG: ABC transporter substrate-binding protein [Caldilineaceae bacterium]|nr:ABC transporter substrate-binding protein [Caldilineaceae bacterium]